jgi:hypothetical protein
MTITLEDLEQRLNKVKDQHARLLKILKGRNITSFHSPKVVQMIEQYEPQLKPRCEDLIRDAGIITLRDGHSPRLDYVKAFSYMCLGKCVGRNLEDW